MSERSYRLFVRFPLLLALASLLIMGTFSKRGLIDYRRMVQKNEELALRIDALVKSKQGFELQMENLKSSLDEQERLIRSTLGYVRPNETVIELE